MEDREGLIDLANRGGLYCDYHAEKVQGGEELLVLGEGACDQLIELHQKIMGDTSVKRLEELLPDLVGMGSLFFLAGVEEDSQSNAHSMIEKINVKLLMAHHESMHTAFQLGVAFALENNLEMETNEE